MKEEDERGANAASGLGEEERGGAGVVGGGVELEKNLLPRKNSRIFAEFMNLFGSRPSRGEKNIALKILSSPPLPPQPPSRPPQPPPHHPPLASFSNLLLLTHFHFTKSKMGEAATIACVSNQQRKKKERWNERLNEGKEDGESRKGRKAGREEEDMSGIEDEGERLGNREGGKEGEVNEGGSTKKYVNEGGR